MGKNSSFAGTFGCCVYKGGTGCRWMFIDGGMGRFDGYMVGV